MILDANAIGIDPPFSKIEHRILLDAHRSRHIVLVIPDLALDEAIHAWKRKLKSCTDRVTTAMDVLQKLLPSEYPTMRGVNLDRVVEARHEELRGTFEAASVQMPLLPAVGHDDLVDRALRRRQPFDEEGSGYRDSLLWFIVREHGSTGDEVVFVSNDAKAFADKRKAGSPLAAQLAAELPERDGVILVTHPRAVIDRLGLVQSEALLAARATLERIGKNLAEIIRDTLVQELSHGVHKWLARDIVNPFESVGASLGVAYDAIGVTVDEARVTEDDHLEAAVVLKVRQWLTIFVPESLLPRVKDLGTIGFYDDDFAGVEVDATVEHRCRLELDPITDRILQMEALEASSASLSSLN